VQRTAATGAAILPRPLLPYNNFSATRGRRKDVSELSDSLPLRPHYDGRGGKLGGLTFRTTLLGILTLLLYRFWARTRTRRYLWSHVLLDGDRFEYTGTGGELFRGFLRVVLVFVPISLVILFLDAFLLRGLNQAQLPLFFVLAIIGSYYARRYRLTRTRWRGIRGNLVGSAGTYLGLSLLHLLHTLLTLGLTYPIYRLATGRYLIAHSWFGDRQFTCAPRYGRLLLRYLPIWLVAFLLALAALAAFWPGIAASARGDSQQAASLMAAGAVRGTILGFAAVVWWLVMFSLYRLWEFRALLDATHFAGLAIVARPRWRILLAVALVTGFVMAVAAFLCFGLVAGAMVLGQVASSDAGASSLLHEAGPMIAAALGALVVYPTYLAIKAMFWTNALVGELIGTIEIAGEPDFARLEQNRDYVPSSGEGLFDVFDFAG
jgi:uncharacterized membrane protein YjgN (DUF898 family)